MLNVAKNAIKSASACLDLTTCRGSTTRIDLLSVKVGSRIADWGILRSDYETLFSFITDEVKGK